MSRSLEISVLVVMLALVPLRTLAGVVSLCDFADQHESMTVHDGPAHDHGSHRHHHPAQGEHCGSAAFVAPPIRLTLVIPPSTERIVGGKHFASGFVPDHLDPPPLPL